MSTNINLPATRKLSQATRDALIHFHMGQPVTDSLALAREFAIRHRRCGRYHMFEERAVAQGILDLGGFQ